MFRFILMDAWPQDLLSLQDPSPEDTHVFSFSLQEYEGKRPKAVLTIANPYPHDPDYQFKKIGVLYEECPDIKILFIGYTQELEQKIEGETLDLTLIGGQLEPEDSAIALDPLAFLFHEDEAPEVFHLKRQGQVPYWCRHQGTKDAVQIMTSEHPLEIKGDFIKESLKIMPENPTPKPTRLKIITEWLQRYTGDTDLTYTIRSLFPGGLVNSFTGESLKLRWWKRGARLGRSRYWIESSYLKEIPAPFTGMLNLYPLNGIIYKMSPRDPLNEKKVAKTLTLKRRWFRSHIILGWEYQQKRREEATLDLEDLDSCHHQPHEISFHLRRVDHLQDPWQKARGRFFTTRLGRHVAQCALELAHFQQCLANRDLIVSVTVPWDLGRDMNVSQSVILEDDRLPTHRASGKIIAYTASVEGETGACLVILKIAIQQNPMAPLKKSKPYLKEITSIQDGVDYPMALEAHDLVESSIVTFGPEHQHDYLQANTYPQRHNLGQVMKEIKTEICLVLKDISARPVLTRTYTIQP